ncbi:MAG: branched-chain amino acid transport system substrate-binding protein [Solirubrobacterales bacterium]|nr:branched-chain amino acid transport system substrate-binding protein [Solirubrobacterales bacterium]
MKQHARRIAGRTKWPMLAIFALLACALVFAACGGSDSSSSSEATTTEEASSGGGGEETEAKGEPIVTWTYTDVNTEGPQYKNIEETERVYQEWINSHGGIAGRPLEAHFCDAHGTPTGISACGREAVAGGAVAVVGNFTFTGDAIIPILEKGKTAQWGNCCAIAPTELTSKISFPMGNQPLYSVGLVKKAVEDGCKNINGVIIEGAEAFIPLMENAAKAEGTKINKFITLPATAQDYSPQVAEATSGGADCLVMIVSETPYIAWMPAFAQSGSEAKMYGPQGNFNENAVKGFEEVVEGDVDAGMYPDISTPAWSEYREALSKYEADPAQDYNSLGGMGTWAAYEGFKQVVESLKGKVDNESFLKAAETAKIDLPGMVPPLNMAENWGKTGGPEGFDRLVNRCVVFSEFKEGKLVPASTEFEDVSEIAGGTKPMDCGPPFG